MRFELVERAQVVFWRSSASLLGIAAAVVGAFGAMQAHLGMLQPLLPPKLFVFVTLAGDAAPGIAAALAAGVPVARIVKQRRLRELTGTAPPPDGAPCP